MLLAVWAGTAGLTKGRVVQALAHDRRDLCEDAEHMSASKMLGRPSARFDDLTPGGVSSAFAVPARTLVASSPHQVLPVLRQLEEETATGWWGVGFIAYEAATSLDLNLKTRQPKGGDPLEGLPLAWFGLFSGPVEAAPLQPSRPRERRYRVSPWVPAVSDNSYRAQVAQIRAMIQDGETYQCNLTLPLRAQVQGDAYQLYCDLALAQRGAYNAYIDTGRFVVASASPELFLDWTDDRLTTRPMKGTSARGRWPDDDKTMAAALLGSSKERAENLMIVDLLRNDVGKLAEPGTVEVRDLCALERFETVWQLTSTVSARLRPDAGLTDILRALFPCGSVTGAPKARTMALIADLEQNCRGVYCGALGVVAPPGFGFRARFSVPIRTVVLDRQTGDAVYGTGGGITWDSSAPAEHQEVMTKAAILSSVPEEFQLLETMGFEPGVGVRNLNGHLRRLADSAHYFGFSVDLDVVQASLQAELADRDEPARVRLLVARNGEPSVELGPKPTAATAPVRLALDREPIRSSEIWLYHKTTRRDIYRTRQERHPEADDVIMVNERGELTETTVANLAVQLDGIWCTPPLDAGCLPGIERGLLLLDGQLTERELRPDDLSRAEGIALASSLRGWRPAVLAWGDSETGASRTGSDAVAATPS